MSDPIAPARGCAIGFVIGGFLWVVIFALAALAWVNVIVPRL